MVGHRELDQLAVLEWPTRPRERFDRDVEALCEGRRGQGRRVPGVATFGEETDRLAIDVVVRRTEAIDGDAESGFEALPALGELAAPLPCRESRELRMRERVRCDLVTAVDGLLEQPRV